MAARCAVQRSMPEGRVCSAAIAIWFFMNLFVIGMNYAPEHTGIAPYTTELCEDLTRRGHCVTVATTFPHYPEWKIHAGYEGKRALTEFQNGVRVKRRAVYLPKRTSRSCRMRPWPRTCRWTWVIVPPSTASAATPKPLLYFHFAWFLEMLLITKFKIKTKSN